MPDSIKSSQQLLNAIPFLYWTKDTKGSYTSLNANFAHVLGHSIKEVIGSTDTALLPQNTAQNREIEDKRVIRSRRAGYKIEFVEDDFSTKYFEVYRTPLLDKNNKITGILGFERDITEEKLSEEELKESEINFSSFFQNIEDFLMVISLKGKVLLANKSLKTKLGYSDDEIRLLKAVSLCAPAYRTVFTENLEKVLKGNILNQDIPLYTKSGESIDVETRLVSGEWNGEKAIYCVSNNVTELKRSKEKLAAIFSLNPLGISITSLKEGMLVDANEKYFEITGLKKSNSIGKETIQLGIYKRPEQRTDFVNELFKNGYVKNYEIILNGAGKKDIFASASAQIIKIGYEDFILTVLDDISERKRSERRIHEALERQIASSEILKVFNSEKSITTGIEKYIRIISKIQSISNIVLLNKGENEVSQIQAWQRNNPINGDSILEFPVNKERCELIMKYQQAKFISSRTKNSAFKYLLKESNFLNFIFVPISIKSEIEYFLLVNIDESITDIEEETLDFFQSIGNLLSTFIEKRNSESKLNENLEELRKTKNAILNVLEDVEDERNKSVELAQDLEKFKLAVNDASDHIVIYNNEGTIIYANNAVEKITGYTNSEVILKRPQELWGSLMKDSYYSGIWKKISTEKIPFHGETTNYRKNGEVYIAEVSFAPVLNNIDEVQFYVGIERDITKAKDVDRMKTEFISLASHQLRTPISTARWYLEMLAGGDAGELNPVQKEFVLEVQKANERMLALVQSLLNISRIESGRIIISPEKTQISELIKNVSEEMQLKANEKKIKIVSEKYPKLQLIMLDKNLIRNVIVNLLSNSIKYSPEETTITTDIKKVDSKTIEVSITDQGYGIATKDQPKIFQKFYRASNINKVSTEGNGLGLYLAKSIIESSGGNIGFNSKIGIGTTFFFTLPIAGVAPKEGEVTIDT